MADDNPNLTSSASCDADRDNRFTSPDTIRAVEESFGRIDFDPCWHEASAVKPVAYLDFRKGQDGLTRPWKGPVAFVDPPWSAAKKLLKRAYDQWKNGNVDKVISGAVQDRHHLLPHGAQDRSGRVLRRAADAVLQVRWHVIYRRRERHDHHVR